MARIKKFGTNKPQKLNTFETFLVDENPNSTYFRITEFKNTFTGGKNGFLIEGSEYLQETTEIKIEVLDVAGNPIYYEPGKGIPEYYEGISKVVSVYVYEDTPIGIGKITILGELKNYLDDGDVLRPIPDEWKGVYNVKWENEFKINRLLLNEDTVRFRKRPKVDIDEITRPIFSTTPILVEQTGVVNGTPLVPIAGTRLAEFSLPTTYLLTITDNSNWSGSVVGSPIQLPNLGVSLDSLDIITNKQLTVSTPYTVNGIVQPFFNQPYTASFNFLDTSLPIESALSGSFAKITVTDLTTFVGDVARVKVFRKSQSDVSDFQFVQEIALESNEILIDLESSQRAQEVYGLFTPSIIDTYWVSSSNNLTVGFNQEFLYNSVKLDSNGVNRFFTEKEVPINEGIEYSLDFNVRLEQNISSDNFISIFLEGERGGLTVRQNITTIQSSNPILQKSNISANFIGDEINNVKLIFEVRGNGWYLSNVSLRASQETAFSPDEITFIQPVPRTLETETFDFRFEFYDINNNYIPVLVEKQKTFLEGNLNRIAKRLELNPSSLYFQFDSVSGIGNPLPPTSIFIEAEKQFLTGSINFTSRSFDFNNNEISASEYIGGQYPGLLIDEGDDIYRLTVENFTGSREDIVVQYIQYTGEVEGVGDSVLITRVSDGKDGLDGDKYLTTSIDELTIQSSGTLNFTIGMGLSWTVGQEMLIVYDMDNYMSGTVIIYDPVSGFVSVDITSSVGSGTYSDWSINLSGTPGVQGEPGETGPGIVFRGEWTGSINYIYDIGVRRRDAVLRNVDNGVHYWATTEQLVTASSAPFTQEPVYPATASQVDAGGWEYLGEQDLFVAAKIAIFEESFVKNTINVGNNPDSEFANIVIAGGRIDPYIAIGQNGTIGVDGDQTGSGVIGYDRAGIFMGTFDSASIKTPRFSLKNGAGDRFLRWDGVNLEINGGNLTLDVAGNLSVTGEINANAGNFTNTVNVGSGSNSGTLLVGTDINNKITIVGTNDASSSKIHSGLGNFSSGSTGFYMDASGRFSLGDKLSWDGSTLQIEGDINITGGTAQTQLNELSASLQEVSASAGESIVDDFGKIVFNPTPSGSGLFLSTDNLGYYDNDNWKTYMSSSGDFFLTGTGAGGLTWNSNLSTLTISGSVNATAGSIGGWVVDGDILRDESSIIKLDPSIPAIEIFDTGNNLRLNIRQGDLPVPEVPITVSTPVILFDPQEYSGSFSIKIYYTGSTQPTPFTVPTTNNYTAQITNPPSVSDFIELYENGILQDPGNATSEFNLTIGAEIHNSPTNPEPASLKGGWNMGVANISNGEITSGFTPTTNQTITIELESDESYYMYVTIQITADVQTNNVVSFQGSTIGDTTNTFALSLDRIDITDEGILVIGNVNNFVRIRRSTSDDVLTTNGSSTLSGSLKLPGLASGTGTTLIRGASDNVLLSTSSRRYKLDIENLNKSLVDNVIQNLRPVWYRANTETTVDRGDWSFIGFIAEEVSDVEPRLVNYNQVTSSTGEIELIPESVQYDRMSVILLSHIQSQSKVIDNLLDRVSYLEEYISGSNKL